MSIALKLIFAVVAIIVSSIFMWFDVSASDKRYWEERDKADMERYLKNRRMNYPDIICEKRGNKNEQDL